MNGIWYCISQCSLSLWSVPLWSPSYERWFFLSHISPCVVGHEITGEVVEHGPFTDNKIVKRFSSINRIKVILIVYNVIGLGKWRGRIGRRRGRGKGGLGIWGFRRLRLGWKGEIGSGGSQRGWGMVMMTTWRDVIGCGCWGGFVWPCRWRGGRGLGSRRCLWHMVWGWWEKGYFSIEWTAHWGGGGYFGCVFCSVVEACGGHFGGWQVVEVVGFHGGVGFLARELSFFFEVETWKGTNLKLKTLKGQVW